MLTEMTCLILSQGMPDLATRAFCSKLVTAFPTLTASLPLMGLEGSLTCGLSDALHPPPSRRCLFRQASAVTRSPC